MLNSYSEEYTVLASTSCVPVRHEAWKLLSGLGVNPTYNEQYIDVWRGGAVDAPAVDAI